MRMTGMVSGAEKRYLGWFFLFSSKEEPKDLEMGSLVYELLLLFCKHGDPFMT